MLKSLFIKRKQLNFQKHIGRAKTNPARQSPRAGPFARRSAPGMLPMRFMHERADVSART